MSLVTVGSSDVAAILGISPWSSPWSAWGRLVGLTERYTSADTPAQARGRMMEAAIGARFAELYGVELQGGPPIGEPGVIGPEPWMHCRPDFWILPRGREALVEVKTAKKFTEEWGPPGSDVFPVHYTVQCAWQMAVCDARITYLAAFAMFTDEFRVYPLRRDLDVERGIVDYVRDWYQRHVVTGDPPPVDGSSACSSLLAGRIAELPRADLRQATDDELMLIDRYRVAGVRRDIAEATRALTRQQIAESIGAADGLTDGGSRLVSLRRGTSRSGNPQFTLNLDKS